MVVELRRIGGFVCPFLLLVNCIPESHPVEQGSDVAAYSSVKILSLGETEFRVARRNFPSFESWRKENPSCFVIQEEGEQSGVKVLGVGPGTLPHRLGLRQFDLIVKVDSQPIDTAERLLKAVDQVPEREQVVVEVVRTGKLVPLTYHVVDDL